MHSGRSDAPKPVSIMAFPARGDAYTNCFYPALQAEGVEVREGILSGRWLWKNLRNTDYVHFHWPSFCYNWPTRTASLRGFAIFLYLLGLTRWRGARILWTVHNLYPHDRCVIPQLDTLTRRILFRFSSRLLVHGASAQDEVLRAFPKTGQRIVLIDHGHWVGYYPNTLQREQARAQLGLRAEDYVFLFFGLCKPYKNLEALISAFAELPGSPVLVIAGKFQTPSYEAAVRAAIARTKARIVLKPGFVADNEVQIYMQAADMVTLPYTEILTSGTALLAMSFGRPAIAPARGHLKDVIVDGCGILYEPSVPDALREAMRTAMGLKFDPSHILAEVLRHDWRVSAKKVAAALTPRS